MVGYFRSKYDGKGVYGWISDLNMMGKGVYGWILDLNMMGKGVYGWILDLSMMGKGSIWLYFRSKYENLKNSCIVSLRTVFVIQNESIIIQITIYI